MSAALNDASLDQLFRSARTHNAWADRKVDEATLRALYDLVKWGPTSANASPARFVFVTTPEGKEKLKPALSAGNMDKTLAAPVTVIVGHDLDFAQKLPVLFPHAPGAKDWFAAPAVEQATAFRNGTLQGAYLILAARALGLDAGPMSGFDNAKVDEAFFAGTRIKSNFLVNLGYGDPAGLFPRSPRLAFEEAVTIA
ncbi:malonic semialdehyde reductase [Zavarzinia aquatilis]|uniref:Putative NADH dehydrogenase/NAD(P)H nitroreductase DKG74_16300 n=1 Tax=Zavarzinia aquatilis TaxID=2211142 RepID=A0A317E0S1_9PROT|nr:malonic semialdehyde reductase [Zavarzinia aquatilis]PWR20241.1 malonic semialdehyde reductase [Zavarzinia aquatilis]